MKLAKLFGAAALFASMVATAHAANTRGRLRKRNLKYVKALAAAVAA